MALMNGLYLSGILTDTDVRTRQHQNSRISTNFYLKLMLQLMPLTSLSSKKMRAADRERERAKAGNTMASTLVADDEAAEEIDTLAGLVFSLVGRVPQRGEIVKHPVGIEFEVLHHS